jgi:hypothetical protein
MEGMKAACEKVLEKAKSTGVRFPKTWAGEEEKKNKMKAAFELLSLTDKTADGNFDVDAVVEKLGEKFGLESKVGEKRKTEAEEETAAGETAGNHDDGDEGGSPKQKKKSKKIPEEQKKKNIFVVEENRDFGSQLQEIADLYYKAGESRKGGTFSKGAKAFRDAETRITTAKEAMSLKGVGKGMAAYLTEFQEKGFIERLEKMRAGEI